MRFKRNKVYVAVDEQERPVVEKKKVLIKYQLDQPHHYWVHQGSVCPLDAPLPEAVETPPPASRNSKQTPQRSPDPEPQAPDNAIHIYTDGACSGNPGPAGIGVVMRYREHEKEISQFIGRATNNIAELKAIKAGLESVKNPILPVIVYTDSSYSLGVLTGGWKARENLALIEQVKRLTARFKNLRMVKVKGHAGHPENERADQLAVNAIERTATGQGL